jgi:putative oxidoreductase
MAVLDIALLITRIILGVFFIGHSYKKLKDPRDMADWLSGLGYRPGILWAWLIIIAEFFGGIGVILGLGTRLFALMMSAVMIQGIYHRKIVKKLPFGDGWDLKFITLASTLSLILVGAGAIALDALFGIP